MRERRKKSLEWLLLGGALLCLGAISGYSLFHSHRDIETRERERLAIQAQVIDANLSRHVDG